MSSLDYILTQTFKSTNYKRCNYYVFVDYKKDKYLNINYKNFIRSVDSMICSRFISHKQNNRLKINYPYIKDYQVCVFCETIYELRTFLKKFTSTFIDYPYTIQAIDELWKD